jgi:hypothetical protein
VRALLLTIALVSLPLLPASAQGPSSSISGTVRDTSGQVLADVQVFLVGTRTATRTDSLGRYALDSLPAGLARVRTAIIGYISQEQTAMLGTCEHIALDFRLVHPNLPDPGNVVRAIEPPQPDSP